MSTRSASLQELKDLLDQGHISQIEYEQRRANVLSGLGEAPAAPAAGGTATALSAGDKIGPVDDQYALERPVGQGGMSQVWLARSLKAERKVGSAAPLRALKLLKAGASKEERDLFEGEAYRTLELSHAHIVRAYDLIEDIENPDDPISILVMEYLEGGSLRDRLSNGTAPCEWKDVLAVLRPIAEALRYAWQSQKLVHRDLKPENVMFDREGRARLVDFGVAAQARSNQSRLGRNASDGSGTNDYLAPEALMIRGEARPSLDVYSLAVMAYELLSRDQPSDRRLPYDGYPSVHSKPCKPAALDERIWKAFLTGLRVDPADRAPTAWEWVQACDEAGRNPPPPIAVGKAADANDRPPVPSGGSTSTTATPISDGAGSVVGKALPAGVPDGAVQNHSPPLPPRAIWFKASVAGGAVVLLAAIAYWAVPGGDRGPSSTSDAQPVPLPAQRKPAFAATVDQSPAPAANRSDSPTPHNTTAAAEPAHVERSPAQSEPAMKAEPRRADEQPVARTGVATQAKRSGTALNQGSALAKPDVVAGDTPVSRRPETPAMPAPTTIATSERSDAQVAGQESARSGAVPTRNSDSPNSGAALDNFLFGGKPK